MASVSQGWSFFAVLIFGALMAGCGGGGGDQTSGGTEVDPSSVSFALSGDPEIDGLLWPPGSDHWDWNVIASGRPLYFTFSTSESGARETRVRAFTEPQRIAARAIMEHVSEVTGIATVEVADASTADLHFVVADSLGYGHARSSPVGSRPSVYVVLNREAIDRDTPDDTWGWVSMRPGDRGQFTLLHEVGHALGLKHPPSDGTGNPAIEKTVMLDVSVGLPGPHEFEVKDRRALYWMYGGDGFGGERGFSSRTGPQMPPPGT